MANLALLAFVCGRSLTALLRTTDAATIPALWPVLALLVVVATLAMAVWVDRRNENLLAVALCGLASCAASPFSWNHHWVWLVPLTVVVGHRLAAGTASSRVYWLAPAIMLPLGLPWIANLANPPAGTPVLTDGPAAALLGNVYVVIYLVVLVTCGVLLASRAGNSRSVPGRRG